MTQQEHLFKALVHAMRQSVLATIRKIVVPGFNRTFHDQMDDEGMGSITHALLRGREAKLCSDYIQKNDRPVATKIKIIN